MIIFGWHYNGIHWIIMEVSCNNHSFFLLLQTMQASWQGMMLQQQTPHSSAKRKQRYNERHTTSSPGIPPDSVALWPATRSGSIAPPWRCHRNGNGNGIVQESVWWWNLFEIVNYSCHSETKKQTRHTQTAKQETHKLGFYFHYSSISSLAAGAARAQIVMD